MSAHPDFIFASQRLRASALKNPGSGAGSGSFTKRQTIPFCPFLVIHPRGFDDVCQWTKLAFLGSKVGHFHRQPPFSLAYYVLEILQLF